MKRKVCGVCGKAYDSGTFYRCPHCVTEEKKRKITVYVDGVIKRTAKPTA